MSTCAALPRPGARAVAGCTKGKSAAAAEAMAARVEEAKAAVEGEVVEAEGAAWSRRRAAAGGVPRVLVSCAAQQEAARSATHSTAPSGAAGRAVAVM